MSTETSERKAVCGNCKHWQPAQHFLIPFEGEGLCLNPETRAIVYPKIASILNDPTNGIIIPSEARDKLSEAYDLVVDDTWFCADHEPKS